MPAVRRFSLRLSLVSLAALAACATPPPPPTPPPPVVPTVMPLPPMGAVENMRIPDKADDGAYVTPSRGVTSNTALWHVRMALNVAALSCRDKAGLALSQYNAMLHVHQSMLGDANAAVDRNYVYAYGRIGIRQREQLNTVVYNFFSLPPVQPTFCKAAIAVGGRMLAMPSGALLAYAPEALAELEKPFQEFYAAYADYLRRLAEWQSRFGGSVQLYLSPTPLPPPPRPPGEAPPPGYVPSLTQAMQASPSAAAATVPPAVPTPAPRTPIQGPPIQGPPIQGPQAATPPQLTIQPLPDTATTPASRP